MPIDGLPEGFTYFRAAELCRANVEISETKPVVRYALHKFHEEGTIDVDLFQDFLKGLAKRKEGFLQDYLEKLKKKEMLQEYEARHDFSHNTSYRKSLFFNKHLEKHINDQHPFILVTNTGQQYNDIWNRVEQYLGTDRESIQLDQLLRYLTDEEGMRKLIVVDNSCSGLPRF